MGTGHSEEGRESADDRAWRLMLSRPMEGQTLWLGAAGNSLLHQAELRAQELKCSCCPWG